MTEKPENTGTIVYADPEIKEFIPEYLENRKRDADNILAKLKESNFADIKALGHKMRGSGKLYGFAEISRIGEAIEQSAGINDCEEIKKLRSRLSTYLDEVEVR